MANYHLFCILRPNSSGVWSVQNDTDHSPYGIDTYVEQGSTYLRIFTTGIATYTKAGGIQITSDDDFNVRVSGHSNLGLSNATIRIYVDGVQIDPADIWTALGVSPGGGNLWVAMDMIA